MTNTAQAQQQGVIHIPRDYVYKGELVLVNKRYPLGGEQPGMLDSAAFDDALQVLNGQSLLLEQTCMKQLTSLLHAIEGTDDIMLVSGYRSKEEQDALYKQSLIDNGEAYTASYVALPGCSEHQTGLAIDVGMRQSKVDFIAPAFPDTGKSGEFKTQAAKFGFIQRYEEGKEELTGISCEPWHYRYIGYPHSFIMNSRKLCLEEYMLLLQRHSVETGAFHFEDEKDHYALYYVKAAEQGNTEIPVITCDAHSWSGDNQAGFIVTAVSCKEAGAERA